VLDRRQADPLADDLRRASVVIRRAWELDKFAEDHPGLFRDATDEEIAAGAETTATMWDKYERWEGHWLESFGKRQEIPLRNLDGSFFRKR